MSSSIASSVLLLLLLSSSSTSSSFIVDVTSVLPRRTPFVTTTTTTTMDNNLNPSSRRGGVLFSAADVAASEDDVAVAAAADNLSDALSSCVTEITKACKVKIGRVGGGNRLGLIATETVNKGDVVLSIPYDDRVAFGADLARKTVFGGYLPEPYESWTGDAGLIALLLLNEVARASGTGGGIQEPQRPETLQSFVKSWIDALPSPVNGEMDNHPLLWSEDDQEILQSSTTNKIYRILDDIEDDYKWLEENIFAKNRDVFPETVSWRGGDDAAAAATKIPCFTLRGFTWALALARSRSFFVDGKLRMMPLLDMCNHSDDGDAEEVQGGTMGTFGTIKGAKLFASRKYGAGDEVFCSYGPKSAADYLLEHGFCPDQCWKTSVSELTFELDPSDRFHDDKLDILEYETYDRAPMDPSQSFDVVAAPGRDGEPDPAMIQFVRLCKLGATDAFLLESIFRKEVWGFMELPVSESNELDTVNAIIDACQSALDDFSECPDDDDDANSSSSSAAAEICKKLRESETRALSRSIQFLKREKEALDLKEYYQERRLKDLGLDSEWTPEDDIVNPDIGYGQTRAPGGADYDW